MTQAILPTLNDIDVCVVDLDGCMIRGISKVMVAQHIGLMMVFNPLKRSHRLYLPRLGVAAAAIVAARFWQKTTGQLSDAALVRLYAYFFAPLPPEIVHKAAARIPSKLLPGVEETFRWLASRWPVGVISLALTEVLEEVNTYLDKRIGHRFAFVCGNRIRELHAGVAPAPVLTSADKRARMAEQLAQLGCHRPLVIGHDREDLGMVDLAREMGGVALGLDPAIAIAHRFDLIQQNRDWSKIPGFLEQALGTSYS